MMASNVNYVNLALMRETLNNKLKLRTKTAAV